MGLIFIVEDSEQIASILDKYVTAEGFETTIFNRGGEVVRSVRQQSPDLIILDVMLPEKSGLDICKELRLFSNVPIIMVTAKVDEIDRLLGLELGADDYVCKPFSPREVIARIKSILRRSNPKAETTQIHEPLYIDENAYQVKLDGCNLELTPVEFRILKSLTKSPIRAWRRSQLLDRMYNDHRAVCDRTVDSHVANLRKKLQFIRPKSEFIQSVYGIGYRYID